MTEQNRNVKRRKKINARKNLETQHGFLHLSLAGVKDSTVF